MEPEWFIDKEITSKYLERLHRRLRGEPVQYILGHREFMGLDFHVNPSVLIPRGDTEVLVEYVIQECFSLKRPRILDLGTGSGAIAVSLAVLIKDAQIDAVDICAHALKVATKNARRHSVHPRIRFFQGDLFCSLSQIDPVEGYDVIVSNPPYIPRQVIEGLMIEVKDYEPIMALDGGPDGLLFYRRILKEGTPYVKPGGLLAVEIGYDQAASVQELFEETGMYGAVTLIPDLAGINRVATARLTI